MKEYKITVVIEQDGSISADTEGFTGDSCIEALDCLLDEAGSTQTEDKKSGYYQKIKTKSQKRISIGRKR